MVSPNSPNADVLDSNELRGALDSTDKTTREGTQYPAAQAPLRDLAKKLRAMQDGLESLRSLPNKPSPPGYGPYGLPSEAAQPLRHLQEQLGRAEALTASVDPKHPFLTVLKNDSEQAEGGDDRANEPPQSKQCVGDLASNGKDHTPVRMEKALFRISWLTVAII
jgi:hypothetical protein